MRNAEICHGSENVEEPEAGGGEWWGPQGRLGFCRVNEKWHEKLQQLYWKVLQEGLDQLWRRPSLTELEVWWCFEHENVESIVVVAMRCMEGRQNTKENTEGQRVQWQATWGNEGISMGRGRVRRRCIMVHSLASIFIWKLNPSLIKLRLNW